MLSEQRSRLPSIRLRHSTVRSEYCTVAPFGKGTPEVYQLLAGSHIAPSGALSAPAPAMRHIPLANSAFPPCEGCRTLYASMPAYVRAVAALLPTATTLRT